MPGVRKQLSCSVVCVLSGSLVLLYLHFSILTPYLSPTHTFRANSCSDGGLSQAVRSSSDVFRYCLPTTQTKFHKRRVQCLTRMPFLQTLASVWCVGLTIANELTGILLLRWKSSRRGIASVELVVLGPEVQTAS